MDNTKPVTLVQRLRDDYEDASGGASPVCVEKVAVRVLKIFKGDTPGIFEIYAQVYGIGAKNKDLPEGFEEDAFIHLVTAMPEEMLRKKNPLPDFGCIKRIGTEKVHILGETREVLSFEDMCVAPYILCPDDIMETIRQAASSTNGSSGKPLYEPS